MDSVVDTHSGHSGMHLTRDDYLDPSGRTTHPKFLMGPNMPKLPRSTSRSIFLKIKDRHIETISIQAYAAWAIVLAEHSENDDVLFGVVHDTPSILPLRCHLDQNNSIGDTLKLIRDKYSTAIALGARHDASLCTIESLSTVIAVNVSLEQISSTISGMAIELNVGPESIGVCAHFYPDLVNKNQAEWILGHLGHVLQQIHLQSTDANDKISTLGFLSAEDLSILHKWNETLPESVECCIHQLVHQQSISHPNSPVACAWDGNLSYAELDELTHNLAATLLSRGLVPGKSFVPILLQKSLWTLVAIHGILRAGGAFVLLDMSFPTHRLQEICSSVDAEILVTSESHREVACHLSASHIVTIPHGLLSKNSVQDFSHVTISPSSPAYAVFTSGSTGKPKGVIIPHSAYVTSAFAHGKPLELSRKTRFFQFASYAFDSSIADHLTIPLLGGCLCIPSPDGSRADPMGEYNTLEANTLSLTPSLARTWDPRDIRNLDSLILGGEAARSADLDLWSPATRVRNIYGPAECTPASTVQSVVRDSADIGLIGSPTGCLCWVVNPDNSEQLTPLGLTGELLIEGPIVGAGYLNEPIKTVSAFIDCPVWLSRLRGGKSTRCYLTGDLVRYVSERSIRYVGRKDGQVKLRGQRIELGEVESHVLSYFDAAETVVAEVIKYQDEDRPPQLVAFVKTHEVSGTNDFFIRPTPQWLCLVNHAEERLRKKIPSYMLPAVYIPINRVPLNPSGKTDRRYLRELTARVSREDICQYSQMATVPIQYGSSGIEKTIQRVWSLVLNLDPRQIGLDSNFFQLGGDSIMAMKAISILRTENTMVGTLHSFRIKSLQDLASSSKESTKQYGDIETSGNGDHSPFALSPVQQFFLDNAKEGTHHIGETIVLQPREWIRFPELSSATEALVKKHPMLRARFHDSGAAWAQQIDPSISESYRCQAHDATCFRQIKEIVRAARRSFNIEHGPLFGIDLFNMKERQLIIITSHHLVADPFSCRILISDLEKLLSGKAANEVSTLPFSQWCQWLSSYARESLPPHIALPLDCPPSRHEFWGPISQNTFENCCELRMELDENSTRKLLAAKNPEDVMQAALLHSFSRAFPNRSPPTIFNGGLGREAWGQEIDFDVSSTVGYFTTLSPTAITLNPGDSLSEVLAQTSRYRETLPGKGWAYFTSRYLHPEGKEAFQHHDPIEILFSYLGSYDEFERPESLLRLADYPTEMLERLIPEGQRFALINVTTTVEKDRLNVHVVWNRDMSHQNRIRIWWLEYERSLELAAEHVLS